MGYIEENLMAAEKRHLPNEAPLGQFPLGERF